MPAPGHEADHRGGREERAHQPVRRQDAHQRERDRGHDDQRGQERAEPADHQNEDQHQHGGKGRAEVAEDFDGDVPFAVPLDGRLIVGERLGGVVDLEGRAAAAELPGVERCRALFIFEDGIDRAFDHAGHVADDVGHRHQVLVVDALVDEARLHLDQLAQRHQRRRAGLAPRDAQRQQILGRGAQRLRQSHHDLHVFLLARQVQQIHRGAADGHLQGLRDGFRR